MMNVPCVCVFFPERNKALLALLTNLLRVVISHSLLLSCEQLFLAVSGYRNKTLKYTLRKLLRREIRAEKRRASLATVLGHAYLLSRIH